MASYLPRLVDPLLDELLASFPAVLLVGPRASGKTTTAVRRADTVMRLDQPSVAAAIANDPDAVLDDSGGGTVLVDEWQVVPEVLGAVKRLVDAGASPGSFVLTGSSNADLGPDGWPATGRVIRVPVWPMSVRERLGRVDRRSIVDRLFDGDLGGLQPPASPIDVRDYVAMALHGGFPQLVGMQAARSRETWLGSYIEQVIRQDARAAGEDRDPRRLRSYLGAIAANSAEVVSHKTLYDAAGVNRLTAHAYDALLELLFVTTQVPAYSSNRLRRVSRASKRYVVDPAVAAAALRVDERAVVRDARLVGSMIDTFVAAQLRPELAIAEVSAEMLHLRDGDGRHEVDLLLEGRGGQVVAIEVKASAAPTEAMAVHLRWLRRQIGSDMIGGVVFHTGPRIIDFGDGVVALPLWALWG